MTMEYIIDGFVNNKTDFQVTFDNEADARKEFEMRKVNCVEVNFNCCADGGNHFVAIDSFNKPFNEG